MKNGVLCLLIGLACGVGLGAQGGSPAKEEGMMDCKETTFGGHKCLEIKTKKVRLLVTTDSGPRVAFWGKAGGANLLFWDKENRARGEWKLYGGHRVWATRPDADESEDAYQPDNGPCQVVKEGQRVTVSGAQDPLLRTRRGMRIEAVAENQLSIDNFIVNEGDMLYSAGVWALTCSDPAPKRRYAVPLGDGSEWDGFRVVMFRKWGGGHTSRINDPQLTFTADSLLIDPQGVETKRMIEAPRGIIAMDAPDQNTTFIKKVAYERGMNYPLGCNVAFYIGPGNFMVEMETMGPEMTLKPGQSVHSVEQWLLTDKALGLADAKLLIGQIK